VNKTDGSTFMWIIFLLILLFWGEPDLYDAIIYALTGGAMK
jgi:hypothetical protein